MTTIDQAGLIARIRRAWADATRPNASAISVPTYDDEGVSAYFAGKTWEGHSASTLRKLDFATSVFTDEAFAYYLPAYLIAAIQDPDALDVVADFILYSLARPERGPAIVARLDATQCALLCEYMELVQEREEDLMDDYIRAIESFVASRCG